MALKAIGERELEPNRNAIRLARAIGCLASVIGFCVLAGWYLDAPYIIQGIPPSLVISPNSAAGVLVSGIGLLALTYRLTRPIARMLGLLLAFVAGTILTHEVTGHHTPIDYLLFDVLTGGTIAEFPTISKGAKIAYTLLGSVLFLTARKSFFSKAVVELLLVATLTLSITNLIGHTYEVAQTFNPFPFTEMPMHLGVILSLLAAGFSAACPDRGFARAVLDTSAGGAMIRRLLPGIIIIPILLGWAVHSGLEVDLYGGSIAIAAFAVLSILIMLGFIWITAIVLRQSDADLYRTHRELEKQRESLQTILVSIADAVIVVNHEGKIVFLNPIATQTTGWVYEEAIDMAVADIFRLTDQTSRALISHPATEAMSQKVRIDTNEGLLERKDEQIIPVEYSASPVLDRMGHVDGAVLIYRDITQRRQAEDQLTMLVRELNHRVRNLLMIVQSIVKASSEHTAGKSAEDMVRVLLDRLRSLGRAHELLLDTHWKGANLKKMVEQELDPYGAQSEGKIKMRGKDILLPPQCTSVIAMSVHELATNAAKYGALSVEGGKLSVSWTLRGSKLTLKWVETGIVVPDTMKAGFGTSLIDDGIRENLGGETDIDYSNDGLTVTLRIPLANFA